MIRILLLLILLLFSTQIRAVESDSIRIALDNLESERITKELLVIHQELYLSAEKADYLEGKYRAKRWIGDYYYNVGYFSEAAKIFLEAYEMTEELNDPQISADALNSIAKVYYIIGELEKAMSYYNQVIILGEKLEAKDLVAEASGGYAHCLAKMERYDEAIDKLKDKLAYHNMEGSEKEALITHYNIGYYEAKNGNPTIGLEKGMKYLDHFKKRRDSFEMSFGYALKGISYRIMNRPDSALAFLDSSLVFSEALDIKRLSLDLHEELAFAHELNNNYVKALEMQREHSRRNKEIYKESTQGNIILLELKSLAARKEKQLIESQLHINNLHLKQQRLYSIIGASLAFLIIALMVFNKKRQDFLKSKAMSDMRNELIESELKAKELNASKLEERLESKQADLTNFALDIARKNEFSTELIDRLTALEKSSGSVKGLHEIINFTVNHLQINQDLALLQGNVEHINNEFYKKLEKLYGDLTTNEKYMAGLLRLNLSNKDIASIKGISTNSAKVSRHRLRKKLHLDSEVDIVKFLQEI